MVYLPGKQYHSISIKFLPWAHRAKSLNRICELVSCVLSKALFALIPLASNTARKSQMVRSVATIANQKWSLTFQGRQIDDIPIVANIKRRRTLSFFFSHDRWTICILPKFDCLTRWMCDRLWLWVNLRRAKQNNTYLEKRSLEICQHPF